MLRSEKKEFVAELEEVYRDSNAVIVTHYHGLTVAQITELRRTLRDGGAKFKVVKNTLSKIAATNASVNSIGGILKGPVAIAYSTDPVAAAKGVVEFSKKNQDLKVIGGIVNNMLLSADQVEQLSKLPSLDELRGKIIGVLQAPATRIANVLQAPAAQIARVLDAYSKKN